MKTCMRTTNCLEIKSENALPQISIYNYLIPEQTSEHSNLEIFQFLNLTDYNLNENKQTETIKETKEKELDSWLKGNENSDLEVSQIDTWLKDNPSLLGSDLFESDQIENLDFQNLLDDSDE
jgi:hypothetical protein